MCDAERPCALDAEDKLICHACRHKRDSEERIAKFKAELDWWSADWSKNAGMSPREIESTVDKIPTVIKKAMPLEAVKGILSGVIPKTGFGIGGAGTGAGKTCALAAIFRAGAKAYAESNIDIDRMPCSKTPWLVWSSWPESVSWMRMNAISDRFPEYLDRMLGARVLFLDDLGSERIKGSYVDDFAASQLDLIVDSRYREMLPTFYTTNLDLDGMTERYGARLVSRLCGENPLGMVSGLPDQRMA